MIISRLQQSFCKIVYTILAFFIAYILMNAIFYGSSKALGLPSFLLFATTALLFLIIKTIFRPRNDSYSYDIKKNKLVYLLILPMIITSLTRGYFNSMTGKMFIFSISTAVLTCILFYILASIIWSEKEGFMASLIFSFWPSHLSQGSETLYLEILMVVFLLFMILIFIAYRSNSNNVKLFIPIVAAFVAVAAIFLDKSFLIIIPSLLLFFIVTMGGRKYFAKNEFDCKITFPVSFFLSLAVFSVVLFFVISRYDILNLKYFIINMPLANTNPVFFLTNPEEAYKVLWSGTSIFHDFKLTYFTQIYYILILQLALSGCIALILQPKPSGILTSGFILFLFVANAFYPLPNCIYLIVIPQLILLASSGISRTFVYIPYCVKSFYANPEEDELVIPEPSIVIENLDFKFPEIDMDDKTQSHNEKDVFSNSFVLNSKFIENVFDTYNTTKATSKDKIPLTDAKIPQLIDMLYKEQIDKNPK